MCIKKSIGKKPINSRKRGGFRMVFQLARETMFEQTYNVFVII